MKEKTMRNEKGFILVLCMMLLLLVTFLGIASMRTGIFGNTIAGNNIEGQKAFWIAESGLQDAKSKLDSSDSVSIFRNITGLSNLVEYAGGSYSISTFTDESDTVNRVIVKSEGYFNGNKQVVETTMIKFYFDGPAALYSEATVKIHGRADIDGVTKPGVATTLPEILNDRNTVVIDGESAHILGQGIEPSVKYNWSNISIAQYISFLKGYVTFPIPTGSVWGTYENPVVVCLSGDQRLGGQSGYGVIVVEGNLEVHGGMNWNGIIVVSGTISFTGGANDSVNINGCIMSGEAANIGTDLSDFGGSMVLRYIDPSWLRNKLGTVRTISWREIKN
jgi:hypothetical protein